MATKKEEVKKAAKKDKVVDEETAAKIAALQAIPEADRSADQREDLVNLLAE
jgi:hypothetical protein